MNHLFSVLNYTQFGTGPLTVFGGVEVGENLYTYLTFILANLFWAQCDSWYLFQGPRMGADQVQQQKQGLARFVHWMPLQYLNIWGTIEKPNSTI